MGYDIYFIDHSNQRLIVRSGDKNPEDEVMYWLGKSPGLYMDDYDEILAYPKEARIDLTECITKWHERQAENDRRYRETAERQQYERLKKKFEQ